MKTKMMMNKVKNIFQDFFYKFIFGTSILAILFFIMFLAKNLRVQEEVICNIETTNYKHAWYKSQSKRLINSILYQAKKKEPKKQGKKQGKK